MEHTPLGFIGLGLMGAPMAMRLIDAGYPVHITNRTKTKGDLLCARGATWHDSAKEAAGECSIVFTMLTNDEALRTISTQIQAALPSEGIHVDCSTVSGSLTRTLEDEYKKSGRGFLHSPVLGSIPHASDGSLLLFAGGAASTFSRCEPLLKILGKKIWRFEKAELASFTKIAMNSFISGMIATMSQALVFSEKSGVDPAVILEILADSALNSPSYQAKGKSILENNFTPRFIVENLLKDTNLFIDAARDAGAISPIADAVRQQLEKTIALGHGNEDYSAIIKSFKA